ncbi:MAG: type 1 glutamine amidotransferase domain-containing protein [Spirochaetia bacterium]|nr:type 1 glutamine amidotransferase domain-containing protein [Spirochaetia bacterium]
MILMPVSQTDFDPSEASIAWKILNDAGVPVVFATPDGTPGAADSRMLTGEGLGVWKRILMARKDAIDAYDEMTSSSSFKKPQKYSALKAQDFKGILLPGGHAPGMRPYLESKDLMKCVADFMDAKKPVGAICHGVLLAARSPRADGKSVLYGRKVTCLLKSQEMAAFNLTRLWLGDYYRTYPTTTTQEEVTTFLKSNEDFQTGPTPFARDSFTNMKAGFTVLDGNLLTARWPGDAYNFGTEFLKLIA